jgi:UDP-N-acetylglucosamine--N-acetylmuramyl-(pentapeptide) pyrophosphoryl-undecaprenol N-acetylglucosamine transferase
MTTVVWPHRTNPLLGMMKSENSSRVAVETPAETLRVVMAGGGTGGHLYPGLAVADALRARAAGANREVDILWAATPRPVDQRLLSNFGDNYIRQPVQPLVKSIKKIWPFLSGWRQSCSFWAREFTKHKTDCVVALGGYAAGPAAYIAAKRGIPVVLLNPDALPGLANRFLLKRADVIVTQWPLAESFTKTIKGVVKPLGCPIRPELTQRTREEAGKLLGLNPKKKTLVITGASLGAKTINDAFLELLTDINMRSAFQANGANWQIVHLAGIEQADAVRTAYAKMPEVQAHVIGYCDDMASVWAMADLTIARAGASTCAELTACGVPSILLPYPFHKDMHQKANAMELLSAGGAVIVDDVKNAPQNAIAIKKALHTLVYDDELRTEMADAARVAGKPHAADQIAEEIMRVVSGR